MKPINKKIAITLLSVTVGLSAFASEYQIKPVQNIDEAVKLIKNLKPKTDNINRTKNKNISLYGYTPKPVSDFSYDAVRDTITTLTFSLNGQGQSIFLVHNKVQNDPTLPYINTSELTSRDYKCSGKTCTGLEFYTKTIWRSNSVGAKLILNEAKFKQANREIVLLNRTNENRVGDKLMNGKPYMKVFIDKNGYLNSQFALMTGGLTSAKTSEPIPFGEAVYIQADGADGITYEVGWKNLSTGKTSRGIAAHQVSPVDLDPDSNPKPTASLNFANEQDFESLIKEHKMTGYFWNTRLPMFSNSNKDDMSKMVVYQQDRKLKIDNTLAVKVISDLIYGQNNFKPADMRVYVDNQGNVIAVDIRETY